MSTNLDTAVGPKKADDVHVTSFAGGKGAGQKLQLAQGYGIDSNAVKLDEGQVRHMLGVMNAWLNNNTPDTYSGDRHCYGPLETS